MLNALVRVFSICKYINLQNLRVADFICTNLAILTLRLIFRLVIVMIIGALTKKFLWDRENLSSFECGFNSKDQGLLPFRFRFYLLANIFLVFDIELILLFPFLIKFLVSGLWFSYIIFIVLVTILSLGLFYEWNHKMLEWVI